MRRSLTSLSVDLPGLILAALLLASPLRADDWPQWLGPQRDAIWRETGILDKFPAGGPKVLWRKPIGAGYTGPAVADGKVYVMDRKIAADAKKPANDFARVNTPGTERVLCLDAGDGHTVWEHEYDCTYTVSYPLGPRTTPTVKDGRVYTLGTEGNVFCLNAATGKPVWDKDLKTVYKVKSPMWGFSAHPLLDGQKLICMVGGKDTTVVAFDKDTGKELWHAVSASEPGYCPPVIYDAGGTRQLIIWDAEAVHGLDPETGKVFWSEKDKSYYGMAIGMPRKVGDRLFVSSTFGHSTMLELAADRPQAKVLWHGSKKIGFDTVFGTPFAEGDVIYGTSSDGHLVCIEAATGKRLWETLEPNRNRRGINSDDIFIVQNGDHRFFLFNELGDLIIARMTPQRYQQIDKAHLLEPTAQTFGRAVVWSHPAFANRRAYLRNDKEIICVSLAAESGQ